MSSLNLVLTGIGVTCGVFFLLMGLIGLMPHFSTWRARRLREIQREIREGGPQVWAAGKKGAAGYRIMARFLQLLSTPTRRRRAEVLRVQFREVVLTLTGFLEVGQNPLQAFVRAAGEVPEPLASEFKRVQAEYNAGIPLRTALRGLARRLGLWEALYFVKAVSLAEDAGGNLQGILAGLVQAIDAHQDLYGDLHARTTEARMTAWILALLPLALGGYFALARPEMMVPLFSQGLGLGALLYGTFSWGVGTWIVSRLSRPEGIFK